jgi:hypothetical protein
MTDDKNLVIAALLIIAILIFFCDIPQPSVNILNNIISGLLGLAVGKAVAK